MAKDLMIFGDIEIPFRTGLGIEKQITCEHVAGFWEKPEAMAVREKQGCYVFALRTGRGYCVWYVGKTEKSFEDECFAASKLNKYNKVLFDGRKGLPVLFFVAPPGNVRKVPYDVCDQVETFLIHAAYEKNPDILNYQKTKIPDWTIAGVYHPGKGAVPRTAKAFRKMMGLHRGSTQKQQESPVADGAESDSSSDAAVAARPNSTTPPSAMTPAEPAAAGKGPQGAPELIGKPA
jgi:hypothetical protein